MFFSHLLDIESAFKTFFTSLGVSVNYDILFYIGLGVEVFLIALFALLSRFSYESRMRRSLDFLNRWLFKYKSLDKDNIKEFSSQIKRAPKRLVNYWQQYILYRDKAPSEYMSADNIIEKPLRASSFATNIKNFVYLSVVWGLITFVLGIAYQSASDSIYLSPTLIVIASITPVIIAVLCTVTVLIMRARKNANLDELYQNLHLFNRFIDNACVELPPYIDYSLLFTTQEIDKGIPALREYLEARARKEKEEFDKIAEEDAFKYEQYDFSSLGIDGQNILERAMKESEAFISKRDKSIAKIAEIEATLDSKKRNFENVQKDFQKKMQVSKENIDRLRQQQEETTSRIESNYLRNQMGRELAKQEKDQEEFEGQQRRFIAEKEECEQLIAELKEEMNGGRSEVEQAMMSEYESFYSKVFKTAVSEAEDRVKGRLQDLASENQTLEEDLTVKETQLKRAIDENENLKRKLGIDDEQIETESLQFMPKEEEVVEEPKSQLMNPEEVARLVEEKAKTRRKSKKKAEEPEAQEQQTERPQESEQPAEPQEAETTNAIVVREEYLPSNNNEFAQVEEYQPSEEYQQPEGEVVEVLTQPEPNQEDNFEFAQVAAKAKKPRAKKQTPAKNVTSPSGKRRGRPRKGEEKKLEDIVSEKRPRGRPRKTEPQPEPTAPKKRGRPVGSTKKPKVEQQKKGRGRPRKNPEEKLDSINKKIDNEQRRLAKLQQKLNGEIEKAITDLDAESSTRNKRDEIMNEINSLKARVDNVKVNSSQAEIEEINKKIETLLDEIKNLND